MMLLEQRVVLEAGAMLAAAPLITLDGRGDNSPVLVIPGFTAKRQSWLLLSHPSLSTSRVVSGRGPTTLISPINTFTLAVSGTI
jgi:hypothetical protein